MKPNHHSASRPPPSAFFSLQAFRLSGFFLGATLALCALNTLNAQNTLQLGAHTFTPTQKTYGGTPVIPLWKAQKPTSSQTKAAGFPVLKDAQHVTVWSPANRGEGGFSHYAALIFHNGRFYAMWANHWHGEDAPGQRILYTTSSDARTWAPPAEVFPPPCPIGKERDTGLYFRPDNWAVADGKLYALAQIPRAKGVKPYLIAREVAGDGALGEPFLMGDLPENTPLPSCMPGPRKNPALAAKIMKYYEDNDMITWAPQPGSKVPTRGIDKAVMATPFTFRSKDGPVMFLRDMTPRNVEEGRQSNRLYVSYPDGKGGWTPPYPTDIPCANARAQARTLPDGRVLLTGNQIAHTFDAGLGFMTRDPLTLAISPDGTTFTHAFALRSSGSAVLKHRFPGITGRNLGYGYPSMIIHDGTVYVLYSVNKEDMAITIVPLDSITTAMSDAQEKPRRKKPQ